MIGTGKIHVLYGNGKGKSTSLAGMTLRAASHGLKVLYYQFFEENSPGERLILDQIKGVTCLPGPEKVKKYQLLNSDEKKEWKRYYLKAFDEIVKFCPNFDMLILDNMLDALALGIISEEKLFTFLDRKPRGLEVILTGKDITARLEETADYITYLEKVKHPADEHKISREGIEY